MHYSKLKVWNKAIQLAESIHKRCKNFPKEELYGLTSQMRRASVSVPSNIAEGSQRSSDIDFARFILIAKGSLAELETQIFLAQRFGYLSQSDSKDLLALAEEVSRMLHALHSKLAARVS